MSHSNKRQRMDGGGGGGGGGAAHRKQGANFKKRCHSHTHTIDKPHGKDEALARLLALNSLNEQMDEKRLDKGGGGGSVAGADDASIGSLAKPQQKVEEASGKDEGHRSAPPTSHAPSRAAEDSQPQVQESKQNNKKKGKQQQQQQKQKHQQGQIKGKEDLMPGRKSVFRPVLRSGLEIAW
ncbi:hypothetical protein CBOM_06339 [Ceraceosorus bombacis]|uniref:Uncharacterized protein n=1 Tax=Ceraceosorus bombacis TaxID=401625 RepID=A0A0P1BST6_9BASI|nr:hypothetical protein CBOM_06339 [Ceraceosorus bombacis]